MQAPTIEEQIKKLNEMDTEGDGGDSDVEGEELEYHSDAVVDNNFKELAGDVPNGQHKSFLKVTLRGSTDVIGEISTVRDGEVSHNLLQKVKLPGPPDDFVPPPVNVSKGEVEFHMVDNPS